MTQPFDELERPARKLEAFETSLLGGMMSSQAIQDAVMEVLEPEHFHIGINRYIFEKMRACWHRNEPASMIGICRMVENDPVWKQVGTTAGKYLAAAAADAPLGVRDAMDQARHLRDAYNRKELAQIGATIQNSATNYDPEVSVLDVVDQAETMLFRLVENGEVVRQARSLAELIPATLENIDNARKSGGLVGITTGFHDINRVLHGLMPGNLYIVGARPSMGKTAFAQAIGMAAARAGEPVVLYSMEMTCDQLTARIVASESRVSAHAIAGGKIGRDEEQAIIEAQGRISALPLHIDDTASLSVAALRTRARRMKRRYGVTVVIVDYLQLMQPARKGSNRVEDITEISRGLKSLAKELDVAVVALSQLSRNVEGRDDKRPMLSDLRESGSIEQDADVVMFLYRDEYYLSRKEPREGHLRMEWEQRMAEVRNLADVIIAKNRHGPIDSVRLRFDAALVRFEDFAR